MQSNNLIECSRCTQSGILCGSVDGLVITHCLACGYRREYSLVTKHIEEGLTDRHFKTDDVLRNCRWIYRWPDLLTND